MTSTVAPERGTLDWFFTVPDTWNVLAVAMTTNTIKSTPGTRIAASFRFGLFM
jgi:hypothetical protein